MSGNTITIPVPDNGVNSENYNAIETSKIVYANSERALSNKYYKSVNAYGIKDAIKITEN